MRLQAASASSGSSLRRCSTELWGTCRRSYGWFSLLISAMNTWRDKSTTTTHPWPYWAMLVRVFPLVSFSTKLQNSSMSFKEPFRTSYSYSLIYFNFRWPHNCSLDIRRSEKSSHLCTHPHGRRHIVWRWHRPWSISRPPVQKPGNLHNDTLLEHHWFLYTSYSLGC